MRTLKRSVFLLCLLMLMSCTPLMKQTKPTQRTSPPQQCQGPIIYPKPPNVNQRPRQQQRPTLPADLIPLTIASEGGISRGAYESGYSWGLLAILKLRLLDHYAEKLAQRTKGKKRPKKEEASLLYWRSYVASYTHKDPKKNRWRYLHDMLPKAYHIVSTAGGSAGNINAFLTTFLWFQKGIGRPKNNPFWNAWVPVGLNTLFPQDPHSLPQLRKELCHNEMLIENRGFHKDKCNDPDFLKSRYTFASSVDASCQQSKYARKERCRQKVFGQEDGLFSRKAFAIAETLLLNRIGKPIALSPFYHQLAMYQYRLSLPIARVTPDRVRLGNVPLSSQNTHTAFEIGFRNAPTQDKNKPKHCLLFSQSQLETPKPQGAIDISISQRVFLNETTIHHPKGSTDSYVKGTEIFKVVKAGSAFPVAFGPMKINVCEGKANILKHSACKRFRDIFFLDGGTFDNLPLNLAWDYTPNLTKLRSRAKMMTIITSRKNHFQERFLLNKQKAQVLSDYKGLIPLLSFAMNILGVAMNYELKIFRRRLRRSDLFHIYQKESQKVAQEYISQAIRTYHLLKKNQLKWQIKQKALKQLQSQQSLLNNQKDKTGLLQELTQKQLKLQQSLKDLKSERERLFKKQKNKKQELNQKLQKRSTKIRSNADQEVLLPHKKHRITSHETFGSHLGSFAGFFGSHFRVYDYYIGIYDAIHALASGALIEKQLQPKWRIWDKEYLQRARLIIELLHMAKPHTIDGTEGAYVIYHALDQGIRKRVEEHFFKCMLLKANEGTTLAQTLAESCRRLQELNTPQMNFEWKKKALQLGENLKKAASDPGQLSGIKSLIKKENKKIEKEQVKQAKQELTAVYQQSNIKGILFQVREAATRLSEAKMKQVWAQQPRCKGGCPAMQALVKVLLSRKQSISRTQCNQSGPSALFLDLFHHFFEQEQLPKSTPPTPGPTPAQRPTQKPAQKPLDPPAKRWDKLRAKLRKELQSFSKYDTYKSILQSDGLYQMAISLKPYAKHFDSEEQKLINHPSAWLRHFVSRAITRLGSVEKELDQTGGKAIVGAAGYATNSDFVDLGKHTVHFRGSLLPPNALGWWYLMPRSLNLGGVFMKDGVNRVALELEWFRPGWRHNWFFFGFPILHTSLSFSPAPLMTLAPLGLAFAFRLSPLFSLEIDFKYHLMLFGERDEQGYVDALYPVNVGVDLSLLIVNHLRIKLGLLWTPLREGRPSQLNNLFIGDAFLINFSIGINQARGFAYWITNMF